jgi:putative two-component system response regulator
VSARDNSILDPTARPNGDRILIVDDSLLNQELLEALLVEEGFDVSRAGDGVEALEMVAKTDPDLVILDIMMPRMDGYEVCRRLKDDPKTRFLPVVMITSLDEVDDKVRGLEVGTDEFLSRPFNRAELLARVRSLLRQRHLVEELDNAENVIYALARAVEAKNPYTRGHSERVARFAAKLWAAAGLPDEKLPIIRKGGLLHDIGKIGIADAVLNKPGRLTDEEFEEMKRHTVIGEEICRPLNAARGVLHIIRSHHEKMDGSGYPDGLAGRDVPVEARVVALVDCYDALTTKRAYRPALSQEKTFQILREETAQGKWDPWLCQILIRTFSRGREDFPEARDHLASQVV